MFQVMTLGFTKLCRDSDHEVPGRVLDLDLFGLFQLATNEW